MKFNNLIWYSVLALAILSPRLHAQAESDAGVLRGTTGVINLIHQSAYQVADVLNSLELPIRAAAIGPKRMLLRGLKKDIDAITQDVIPQIDLPDSDGSTKTAFIPLGSQDTRNLKSLLETVTIEPTSQFAIDPANRMLVARANESELHFIRELLEVVGQPTQPLMLQFFFMRGKIGGGEESNQPPLPKMLRPVTGTLRANGLGSLSLLAPIIVVADANERFDSHATLRPTQEPGAGKDDLTFQVRGEARIQSGDIVQLTIEAILKGAYLGGSVHFSLETTLAAKLGSYVILGASPSSTAEGDAVALAVRVTRSNGSDE
jgi:hypothetical protein